MGMAASQARLLSLTSRLHDIELKAQNIESQKIALATQEDELYKAYDEALSATKIKVAFWNGGTATKYMDANFSSVCTYNASRCSQYTLTDNKTGKVLVTNAVKEAYDRLGKDKYAFALELMGCEISDLMELNDVENSVCTCKTTGSDADYNLKCKYDNMVNAKSEEDKDSTTKCFKEYLYEAYAQDVYNCCCGLTEEESDFDINELNFYLRLWEAINQAGGCQVINPAFESGEDGTNWFNNAVNAGLVTIKEYNTKGVKKEWTETSPSTNTCKNYLQEMPDEKDQKRIEAKYEHDLKVINDKDANFDKELSKLETERTALKTEIDSIKKVKDDNIERTFGIFS